MAFKTQDAWESPDQFDELFQLHREGRLDLWLTHAPRRDIAAVTSILVEALEETVTTLKLIAAAAPVLDRALEALQ